MNKNKKINKSVITVLVVLLIGIILGGIKLKSYFNLDSKESKVNVSTRTLNDEFFKSMSEKESIHYKILNSVYFIDTIKVKINDEVKDTFSKEIFYIADVKNKKSYSNDINSNSKENKEMIISNNIPIEFDNNRKTYQEFRKEEDKYIYAEDYIKLLKPKERYDDNNIYSVKNFLPFLGIGSDTIFGNTVADKLASYGDWDIVGEKDYLNRKCVEIKIKETKTKLGDNMYVLVDKETGIILEQRGLMGESDVRYDTKVVELEINPVIDSKVFDKDKNGYNKQ